LAELLPRGAAQDVRRPGRETRPAKAMEVHREDIYAVAALPILIDRFPGTVGPPVRNTEPERGSLAVSANGGREVVDLLLGRVVIQVGPGLWPPQAP
jgi:hypothetical protein